MPLDFVPEIATLVYVDNQGNYREQNVTLDRLSFFIPFFIRRGYSPFVVIGVIETDDSYEEILIDGETSQREMLSILQNTPLEFWTRYINEEVDRWFLTTLPLRNTDLN
ncbi:MAG: hypothetical protein ACRCU2_31510 [Planktothrix sp.]